MAFYIFISCLIIQRLLELYIAKRNESWLRAKGAVESGKSHYPYMVLMHTAFIIALIVEYHMQPVIPLVQSLLIIFAVLILLKVWVIATLGRYWNTKILRVPGETLINKGPYRYVKHPNYIIVVCEIAVIPLIFHLYFTAILFSFLNALMLYVRIKEENKILNL